MILGIILGFLLASLVFGPIIGAILRANAQDYPEPDASRPLPPVKTRVREYMRERRG
jgi:hypothetical protein